MFDFLFSPLSFRRLTLPNRVCLPAHRTNFGNRGLLTDRHIAYYRRRAVGGCGLIILGELCVHPNDRPWETMIEAYRPQVVPQYRTLAGAIHGHGTLVFAHLLHHGFQSSGAISREAIWGPSAIADIVFGETSKPMELEDMEESVEAFSRAAIFAKEGGLDGVEIDMGPESLLRQFLSPISNLRQDEFGGSLENRMRFPLRVLEGVRKTVGQDFTTGIRLSVDEKFWGGLSIDESVQAARIFERMGCDFIHVSVGTYYNLHLTHASMHTSPGFTVELSGRIREAVGVPVIAGQQINFPHMAEDVLTRGQADAVGVVRQLICDPDAPNKARQGKVKDIRFCVRDNQGCVGRVNQAKGLSCTQNPSVGYESADGEELRGAAPARKRVIVVGGGPGGLEAARAAGARGHEVTLYEKERVLGGQVSLIHKRPGRQPMEGIIHNGVRALERVGVQVITGVEMTPDLILEKNPDAVIVATGSRPRERPVAGEYGPPWVLNVGQALDGSHAVGRKVLFVDENGGHHATATVELLADQGREVTMVTSDLFIGIELAPLGDLYLTRQRLLQKGVVFTSDVVIDLIEGQRAVGRDIYTNRPIHFEGFDTIILDMGNVAEDSLYFQLKGRVKELYRIGDCVAPRSIGAAILEGRRAGEKV